MVTSLDIVPRTNVVPGARDDTYRVGIGGAALSRVQTRDVTLDAAAVGGLTAEVELLPTPAAGTAYVVLGVYSDKAANAYADGAAVTVNYQDTPNTLIGTIPLAHFSAAGADARWATRPAQSGTPAAQTIPAAGIDMVTGTAFTGNGGAVTVTVRYITVDL